MLLEISLYRTLLKGDEECKRDFPDSFYYFLKQIKKLHVIKEMK
jgi:hypothetical protein